jgi:cytochrome P450
VLFPSKNRNRLESILKNWGLYGDIVFSKIGPINNYTLFSPEYVYHVLVTNQKNYVKGLGYNGLSLMIGRGILTSDGDLWKRQRRLMSPHFTPVAVLDFSTMMARTIKHMLEHWEETAQQKRPVNMDLEMMRLTMSIIGQALFSFDLGQTPTEIGHALQSAFAFVPTRSLISLIPMWVPLPAHRQFAKDLKVIDAFLYEKIAEGRLHPERQNFLSTMLKVRDAETGEGMSDRQLRDEVITLFFAGFETTARTLTWAWYLLGRHPEIQEKVREEARQVLGDGHLPTKEDLEKLTYARMVVDETLRLYPPTVMVGRQNIEADEIGGYKIPAKSMVSLSPYIVHRYPKYWPDPERFDPERFSAENAAGRPKAAYIPFVAGPRICIGNSFALMEMVYTLAMTTLRFKLEPATPDEEIPADFRGTIRPAKELYMQTSLIDRWRK